MGYVFEVVGLISWPLTFTRWIDVKLQSKAGPTYSDRVIDNPKLMTIVREQLSTEIARWLSFFRAYMCSFFWRTEAIFRWFVSVNFHLKVSGHGYQTYNGYLTTLPTHN